MDAKCRVSIPVDWRPENGVELLLLDSKREDHPVLRCFSETRLNALIETVQSKEGINEATKNALIGRLNESCVGVSINAQGKLLVPKRFAEKCGLDGEIVLAGRGPEFEIRSTANHHGIREREEARLAEISADLGIL